MVEIEKTTGVVDPAYTTETQSSLIVYRSARVRIMLTSSAQFGLIGGICVQDDETQATFLAEGAVTLGPTVYPILMVAWALRLMDPSEQVNPFDVSEQVP